MFRVSGGILGGMSREDDMEVERFRTVVSDQFLGQLKEAKDDRQEILRELQEYAALLVVIHNMQNNKADKINIRASLGHQVFVNAELDKRDTIIVKLCGDLFAELKLERAEKFVTEKLDVLRKRADFCLELVSKIEATMNFIMAAVGEYDKLAKKR
nr:Prefoldin alpha domain containing protein [Haemonchus contortus]